MRLLWMTDLHLECADPIHRKRFFDSLGRAPFDAAVITGDISNASLLPDHLLELGRVCNPRTVYFILGNHDFHGSSFAGVDAAVADVCERQRNLHHLGHQGEIIALSDDACLIGHRGWADGRAGYGRRSLLRLKDAFCIDDLRCGSKEAVFSKMKSLGKASGDYFREWLPYALKCYDHVWVATHVPPFEQAATFSGKQCGPLHLPHYSNISAGGVICGVAHHYPGKRVTVLCGHTHSLHSVTVGENVSVHVGGTKPYRPQVQWVFDVN